MTRVNGEGTVYRRKDGRYEGAAYVLTTAGTRKRIRVYGATWDEAHRKLTELIARDHKGIPVATSGQTVGEYLTYWLEQVARHKVRPSTYRSYETYVRLYLLPGLGRKRLEQLQAKDIRVWLNKVRETCQCCTQGHDQNRAKDKRRCCAIGQCCGRFPSPRTVQYLHALLRAALQHAVREDLLSRNVAKNVQVSPGRRKRFTPLSSTEAKALLKAAREDRLYALYAVALGIGLRRGEALGLRWVDVDLEAGELHVRQALQRVKGGLIFTAPKSDTSERSIPLAPPLVAALREHRDRQQAERQAAGARWQESGLVFTTPIGTAIEPRNLSRSFAALCDRAGVRRVRFHDLRHSCATLLYEQGVEPRTIMEILGHSTITITLNVYAHVMRDVQRDALNRLGGVFDD